MDVWLYLSKLDLFSKRHEFGVSYYMKCVKTFGRLENKSSLLDRASSMGAIIIAEIIKGAALSNVYRTYSTLD